jgi:hypothetical protein
MAAMDFIPHSFAVWNDFSPPLSRGPFQPFMTLGQRFSIDPSFSSRTTVLRPAFLEANTY